MPKTETGDADRAAGDLSAADERRNIIMFCVATLLGYLAAPVTYVGVVQATLCAQLGANATLSNLPFTAYLFGSLAPLFSSWLIPYRFERAAVVWTGYIGAALLAAVGAVLVFPAPNSLRIATVIIQPLVYGFAAAIQQVYLFQCLKRGTREESRARALKITYTLGPIAAVVGSLASQYILDGRIPSLTFPYNFAALYLIGVPCMVGTAVAGARFRLMSLQEEGRASFVKYMAGSVREFIAVRPLLILWFAYVLWYGGLSVMPNLSLYAKEATGTEAQNLVGYMLALRFGFKALSGFAHGLMAERLGPRAPLFSLTMLIAAGTLWAWLVPGHAYLLAFGLLGAAELGGAYYPNYCLSISRPENGARNVSILWLANSAAGLAAAIHGVLTDTISFYASFTFACASVLFAIILVSQLPARGIQEERAAS